MIEDDSGKMYKRVEIVFRVRMQDGASIPNSCMMVGMPVVHGRETFASAKRDVEGYGRQVFLRWKFSRPRQ